MKILLIDDHPMTLAGYVSILKQPSYEFYKASSCKDVYDWLKEGNIPDVTIIDYNIPAFIEQNLYNGVDCTLLIHQYSTICKNIIVTAHDEALILYKIYKSAKLDALIVKTDFTSDMIRKIISQNREVPFLSEKAKFALQEVKMKETLLSNINIEILMYLEKGFKVSQMNDFLSLSTVAIQKRLNKMLKEFRVKNYHELLQLAKKMNLF